MLDSPEDDEFGSIWDDEPRPDPTSASVRTPSLKELAAQIKDLQRENFQLKLRVHLTETKGVADPITTTTPKRTQRDIIEIEKEYQVLKMEKEQLEIKLRQTQSQLIHEINLKNELMERESSLLNKYSELKTQLEFYEREMSLIRYRTDRGINKPHDINIKSVGVNTTISHQTKNTNNNSNNNCSTSLQNHGEEEDDYESSFLLSPPGNRRTRLLRSTPNSTNWLQKYEEELRNAQALEGTLCQIRNELQAANNDRLLLLQQLKSSENIRKKEVLSMENRLKESLDHLSMENKALRLSNDGMKLALEKADERAEAMRKKAVMEMSNQLHYHQTALEKVHKEQSLLIEELQTLKKSCPFRLKPSTALQLCHGDEGFDERAAEGKWDTTWNKSHKSKSTFVGQRPILESSYHAQFLSTPKNKDFDDKLKGSKKDSGCKMNIIEDYTETESGNTGENEKQRESEKNTVGPCSTVNEETIALVNLKLHEKNSKLAIKLKKTRESLKNAISMLEYSEKDKAGMEKIICRQLHRTHSILAEVKTTLIQSRCSPAPCVGKGPSLVSNEIPSCNSNNEPSYISCNDDNYNNNNNNSICNKEDINHSLITVIKPVPMSESPAV